MKSPSLRVLGWKPAFEQQLTIEEEECFTPVRVAAHYGSGVLCFAAPESFNGHGASAPSAPELHEWSLPIGVTQTCGELAVGDWLLLDQKSERAVRRLERQTVLARKAAGERAETQLIASNLDTLFIVCSCNHDFNPSRLERYLALAAEADIDPVIVLTKSDLCSDPHQLRQQASALKRGLIVECMDARDPSQAEALADWCRVGQTVALVGSSGVGKSTLAMTLGAGELATSGIREDDSKGRHTTTARCLHQLNSGGLLIDTPGMREIQLTECEAGVAEVFDDVLEFAESCRFRDCAHEEEPGCAVQAAIDAGLLDPRRLKSYRKLQSEQARNSQSLRQQRHDSRKRGQMYKTIQATKRRLKGDDD